jgi:5-methylcytosine-specific restriction endonuclease McrA
VKPKLYPCVTEGCWEPVSSPCGPYARCVEHRGTLLPKKPTSKPKREGISIDLRQRVLERDGHRCVHCGIEFLPRYWGTSWHLDHIIPASSLGPSKAWNLVTSCPGCNLSRQHRGFDLVLLAQTIQREAAAA